MTRACGIAVVLGVAALGAQDRSSEMVEWRYVGAEQAHTKYSPLDDINVSNVDQLEVAWTWEPNELPNQEFGTRPGSFEATPLMLDNVVYLSTMYTRVVALDAVAEVSKQGFVYVFDRATGEPVWPIEERPVDTETDVPGEVAYPTQPFPTKPPPFAAHGVSLDDANDLTPEVLRLARAELETYRLGPLFTPPSLRGTLQRPRVDGGANWGGAAFGPDAGMLYVRTSEGTSPNQVCKSDGADPEVDVEYTNNCPRGAAAGIFRGRPGAAEVERSRLGPIPPRSGPVGTR